VALILDVPALFEQVDRSSPPAHAAAALPA
jgi:hypothetical protein